MNRFAELLDRLAYEPGRNNKLRLITAYFREVPDPDRGYALAALTGALSFKHAKPGLVRDLIIARTDPVLFGLSYDYVGDLSQTVAVMWPKAGLPGRNNPPPPTLPAVVITLRALGKSDRLCRGMEMGRHPRAGGQWPRRTRPPRGAALFAQRRGHHQELSGSAAVAASARRDRR